MPYKFTFDISKAPQHFFIELAIVGNQMGIQKVFEKTLQELIRKFGIDEVTGLNIQDAVVLIQDLLKMQTLNLIQKQEFLQTKKRALFLVCKNLPRSIMFTACKSIRSWSKTKESERFSPVASCILNLKMISCNFLITVLCMPFW